MSALLLDTQLLIWLAFEPTRLSSKAKRLLQAREQTLLFSLASVWEVAIKTSLGRSDFVVEPERFHDGLLGAGFQELGIQAKHLQRVALLPWLHRDPFDRLLVAQAMVDGLTLLTADRALKAYGRFVNLA